MAGNVVGAEFGVGGVVGDQVPADDEDRVRDGDQGPLMPAAFRDPPEPEPRWQPGLLSVVCHWEQNFVKQLTQACPARVDPLQAKWVPLKEREQRDGTGETP